MPATDNCLSVLPVTARSVPFIPEIPASHHGPPRVTASPADTTTGRPRPRCQVGDRRGGGARLRLGGVAPGRHTPHSPNSPRGAAWATRRPWGGRGRPGATIASAVRAGRGREEAGGGGRKAPPCDLRGVDRRQRAAYLTSRLSWTLRRRRHAGRYLSLQLPRLTVTAPDHGPAEVRSTRGGSLRPP